eukprot:g44240.t1
MFIEVVTMQIKDLEERGEWVTTRQSRKNRQVLQESPGVPLMNQCSSLEAGKGTGTLDEYSQSQASGTTSRFTVQGGEEEERKSNSDRGFFSRGADRHFCGQRRDSRMVCCLPGARVRNVSEQLQGILKEEGDELVIMVHGSTDDIGKVRNE